MSPLEIKVTKVLLKFLLVACFCFLLLWIIFQTQKQLIAECIFSYYGMNTRCSFGSEKNKLAKGFVSLKEDNLYLFHMYHIEENKIDFSINFVYFCEYGKSKEVVCNPPLQPDMGSSCVYHLMRSPPYAAYVLCANGEYVVTAMIHEDFAASCEEVYPQAIHLAEKYLGGYGFPGCAEIVERFACMQKSFQEEENISH
jgi:hypothetical protein